jgi:DNA-binding HxlR family transcriptional regulator
VLYQVKQDISSEKWYLKIMARTQSSEEHCQATVLKLLGDYTTLRIIDFLRTKELRFTELQRAIGDVNTVTLSSRLKRLESAGILDRREATVDRQSVVYRLTSLGEGLLPVLREIQRFTRQSLVPASRRTVSSKDGRAVPRSNATNHVPGKFPAPGSPHGV